MAGTPPVIRGFPGWAAVAAAFGLAALLWLGSDAWWPTFILLYGPRWVWLGLLVFVLPGWRNRSRTTLQLTVTATVLAFCVLGVRIGRIRRPSTSSKLLRVLTLNSESRPEAVRGAMQIALQDDVKIVAIQECPQSAATMVKLPPGWQTRQLGELCLFSALPIDGNISPLDRDTDQMGWKGAVAKVHITGPWGPFTLGLVHLRSVHSTLQDFLDFSTLFTHDSTVRREAILRDAGSEAAAAWFADSNDPAGLVMGDFNLPPESRIFRRHWSSWQDAFNAVGWGTGYTWHSKWHGLRIDHILVSRANKPIMSVVGKDVGSVHRPVIAEFLLPLR